jgi:hypothetical protein
MGNDVSENQERKEISLVCVNLSKVTKTDDEGRQKVARRDDRYRWEDDHDRLASQTVQRRRVLGQQLSTRAVFELLNARGDFEESKRRASGT